MVEGRLDQPAQALARVAAGDVELVLQRADAAIGFLQHGEVELLLAAEIIIDHPLRGAGPRRDRVDAGAGIALRGEFGHRHFEDVALGALGVVGALRWGWHALEHHCFSRPFLWITLKVKANFAQSDVF